MHKTPVHIISGFLGAGKTTAILGLLEMKGEEEQWAILDNEFGKISIDGKIFQAEPSADALFEISGGCICCSAQLYFAENLEKIVVQKRFSRILIEPSGLGGIDQIISLVDSNPDLEMQPVVCVVDLAMTRIPRLKLLPLFRRQIERADQIFFSKRELMSPAEFATLLAQFEQDYPGKMVLESLNMNTSTENQSIAVERSTSGFFPVSAFKKDSYREFSFKFSGTRKVNPERFTELLANEPSIVRAKGYIYGENGWLLFNQTLTGSSLEPCMEQSDNELIILCDSPEKMNIPTFKQQLEQLFTEV